MKMAVDGVIVPAAGAGMDELPAGPGVFETLLVRAGEPVFLEDHWARFAAGCRWYGFEPPAPVEELGMLAGMLANENAIRAGILRFAAWRNAEGVTWRMEAGPPRPHMARRDFRVGLGVALPTVTADRPFKHLNRGPWLEALRRARLAGWDEAVLPDPAGQLVEACVSNVFFVQGGHLQTPSLEVGPLPGIMRGRLLALARERGIPVSEGAYPVGHLAGASEVWLSNSLIGLRAVTVIEGCQLEPEPPILQQIRAGWRAAYGWDPVVVAAPS
jgi:branched-subunit amino acid aminotransferase/4-amino-4-deoxychorismate lyase